MMVYGVAEANKAIAHIQLRSFVIGTPSPHSPPPTHTASIFPTTDSEETHRKRMTIIENAQNSIVISGSLVGGHVGDELLYAIDKRLTERPGLKVVIITLPQFLANQSHPFGFKNKELVASLARKFPDRFSLIKANTHTFCDPGFKTVMNHTKVCCGGCKVCGCWWNCF